VDSPTVVAILVFLSIYLLWFLIRLFADLFLVGIALVSATLAYNIESYYEQFLMVLQESNLLNLLSMTLPEQADSLAVFKIAGLITASAVLISIPILPFSATYRHLLGIENPLFARKEAKVRGWIIEEIQRYEASQLVVETKESETSDSEEASEHYIEPPENITTPKKDSILPLKSEEK
jgi:hypothetical protein